MAKVLLVEDDNNLREIYEARLAAEGYDISSAQDGEEALVVAKQAKPDLVISDVMMPKISGFEMLDILRNTEGLEHVKVIMLTALGQSEDRDRADSLGADKYLVKSQVTLEDIVKTAHELLDDEVAAAPVVENTQEAPTAAVEAAVPAPEVIPVAAVPEEPPANVAEAVAVTDPVVEQPATEADVSQAETVLPEATPTTDTPVVAPTPDIVAEQIQPPDVSTAANEPAPEAPIVEEAAAPETLVTPTPEESATTTADDAVMANAVNELAGDSEVVAPTPTNLPAATTTEPAPAESVNPGVTNEETPAEAIANAEKTNISISGKKTIQPLDSIPKPDIHELLAQEEAANTPTAAPVASETPKNTESQVAAAPTETPAIVHQPGDSFTPQPPSETVATAPPEDQPSGEPTPSPAPSQKDGIDPNSIAL